MIDMEGLTIKEMADILNLEPNTVKQRLFVAKIKPMTKDALYDKSALDTIKNIQMGRPKKAPEPSQPGKAKKP
jgi:predicted ArsR family transcriptional regulator